MAVLKVFICHATQDSHVAEQLDQDLNEMELDIITDLKCFYTGDDLYRFINESIALSGVYLLLISKQTDQACIQKEEIAAIWKFNTRQQDRRIIVVKYGDIELDPLLDVKGYLSLKEDLSDYSDIVAKLKKELSSVQPTSSETYAKAFKSDSKNPFRFLRAEDLEILPGRFANKYAPHNARTLQSFQDDHPAIVEGARGSGKSMLLFSTRARNLVQSNNLDTTISSIFGCYLKVYSFSFNSFGYGTQEGHDPDFVSNNTALAIELYQQEMYWAMLEELFDEIKSCIDLHGITINADDESKLVSETLEITDTNKRPDIRTIKELSNGFLRLQRRKITDYAKRVFIFHESLVYPCVLLDKRSFADILNTVKRRINILHLTTITFLLDELENLRPFQRTVVNTMIKLCRPDYSIKAAQKPTREMPVLTLEGQPLQETHDYHLIEIVYPVEGKKLDTYCDLLEHIVSLLLKSSNETVNLDQMLPSFAEAEVSPEEIEEELRRASAGNGSTLSTNSEALKARLREAVTYRILATTNRQFGYKRFAGKRDLARISNGIIRYFLEILGIAFHIHNNPDNDKSNREKALVFSPETQNQAVHIVSAYSIHSLARSIAQDGIRLKYFVSDLASLLRLRLLKSTSEPVVCRFLIKDVHRLQSTQFAELGRVLEVCIREGIFHKSFSRTERKAKHSNSVQPEEIELCRIFAPSLGFCPHSRWTYEITCDNLLGIWDIDRRHTTMKSLLNRIGARNQHSITQNFEHPLFDERIS